MNKLILEEDIQTIANDFPFLAEAKNKVFLVTGATGLIGSIIIKSLTKINKLYNADIAIYGLARNKKKVEELCFDNSINWILGDISDDFLCDKKFDYIIHAASPTQSKFLAENPVETIEKNVIGAINLLRNAKDNNSSLVFLSSVEVYGQILQDHIITEDHYGIVDPLIPRSGYAESKKLIECLIASYAQEYGLKCNICRLTQTFGAGISENDNRIFALIAHSVINNNNIALHTSGESAKPYIYTVDAVLGIFYVLFKGRFGEAYNLANDETYISVKDMAQKVIDNNTTTSKLIFEYKDNNYYAPTTKANLDTSKIKSLGWKAKYNLETMYARTIAYLKD